MPQTLVKLVLCTNLASNRGITTFFQVFVKNQRKSKHLVATGIPILLEIRSCYLVGYSRLRWFLKIKKTIMPSVHLTLFSGGKHASERVTRFRRGCESILIHVPRETLGDGVRESYKLWHINIIWKLPINWSNIQIIQKILLFSCSFNPMLPSCCGDLVGVNTSEKRESTRLLVSLSILWFRPNLVRRLFESIPIQGSQ